MWNGNKRPLKIKTKQFVHFDDWWWSCLGFVLFVEFGKIWWFMLLVPCYLCIHNHPVALQQRCHIPFLPIGQHHAMAQADAQDARDAELRYFSANGCGKWPCGWTTCNDVPPYIWTWIHKIAIFERRYIFQTYVKKIRVCIYIYIF